MPRSASMMNRTILLRLAVFAALAGCRSAGTRVSPVPVASSTAIEGRVPTTLGAFRQVERETLPKGLGTSFRFRDSSGTRFTLFIYEPEPEARAKYPETAALLEHEAEILFVIMEAQERQGAITGNRRLATRRDSVDVDRRVVPGHMVATASTRGGEALIELEYLYLVDAKFVKVRISVPAARWPRSDLEPAIKTLLTALAS